MKKKILISVLAAAAVLALLLALPRQEQSDHVTFYYARRDFSYSQENGAMAPEFREVGRKSQDLSYLLALYLEGPMDSNLKMPFPGKNIDQVQTLLMENGVVTISLGKLGVNMSEGDFSLSCACLARTCLEITGAETVTITSGDRSRTMDRNNLLLFDESTWATEPKTEERE